jgi:hippurate hydrolase
MNVLRRASLTVAPTGPTGVLPEIAARADEAIAIRHDLHRHPELAFEEHRTSARVAELLQQWGYTVTTGVGGTGVVGTLQRGQGSRRLGLRADIDALPIQEASGLPYASQNEGRMHACGHDGHTAILLSAAHYLARHGRIDGTLQLVFQPAEETGSGASRMLADGLFERFPVDAIYGLHNWPGVPVGHFGFVDGPAMASVDWARLRVIGKGGHGAEPQGSVDPILAAAHIVTALQSVVSRNVDPRQMGVVTVGSIHGGQAANVIPDVVELTLTVRAYLPDVRDTLRRRVTELAEQTAYIREVALQGFGAGQVLDAFAPRTASEDFAFLLQARPGSFVFVGNGDSASLHSPRYVFNDAVIAPAASLWARLAEHYLVEDAA